MFESVATKKMSQVIEKSLKETGEYVACFMDFEFMEGLAKVANSQENLVGFVEDGTLKIFSLNFVKAEKVYLRFGIVPENESSYNFLTKGYENGVSVFEMKDGQPVLNNLQLIDSFSGRYDLPMFFVTGEEIGKGQDGEPLLKNVKYVSKADFDITSLTIEALDNNFQSKAGELDEEAKEIHRFFLNGFELTYAGFTYSNPVDGFNAEMGL